MSLVTDTWGANLNPAPKTFKMYKTLAATAVSGSAVSDTETIFTKNCPFNVDVIGCEVHAVSVSGAGFQNTGAALTVALQSSDEVDVSPSQPTTVGWDTVVSVNASGRVPNTDALVWRAPSSGNIVATLDKSFVSVPKGGSLRTTLSCQAENGIGVSGSTPVELLVIVECVPTATRDQRYF